MTPIEIIAAIMIVASAIKILVLSVKPKAWIKFAKKVYSHPTLTILASFAVAMVILYYLLMELTIVQIIAVCGFMGMLIIMALASNVEYLIKKYEAQAKRGNLFKENWLYFLLWVVLLSWGAKEIFF